MTMSAVASTKNQGEAFNSGITMRLGS